MKLKPESFSLEIKWDPEGWLCPHCGTSNPDGGDKCGNCDENPFALPKGTLTSTDLKVLRSVIRHRTL